MSLRPEELVPSVRTLLEANALLGADGGRVLWSGHQRHHTQLVDNGRGQLWFIKRCGQPLVQEELSLARELTIHRLLQSGELPLLAAHVAALVAADEVGATLVFEGVAEPRSLRELFADPSADLSEPCAQVGRALATLHAQSWGRPPLDLVANPVQTYGRYTPEMLGHGPRATFELLQLVQSRPELNATLRELRDSWRGVALIHGDLKTDNIVVTQRRGELAALLIDWEIAGFGDPAWDCGSLLGSLIYSWLESMHVGITSETHRKSSDRAITAFRAFWRAYEGERASSASFDAEHESGLAFRWAGYWLVQRVMISLPLRRSLSALDVSTLHAASQLLDEEQGAPFGFD